MKKLSFILLLIAVFASASGAKRAYGLGECGLSCCLAGAAGGGVALAENFGVSLVYENAWMETIREGTGEVRPDDAIARNRQAGTSYKVPLNMRMQKVSLVGAYPVNERLTLLASVPYVINDMEMRNMNAMSMVMDMRMETVSGLGDATLLGLYTLHADAPVRPAHRLTLGLGLKTPIGRSEERTASGSLVHAMMQTGSGSWDPVFMVNYMRGLYPLVLQATLFYQMTTGGGKRLRVRRQVHLRPVGEVSGGGLHQCRRRAERHTRGEGHRPRRRILRGRRHLDGRQLRVHGPYLDIRIAGGAGQAARHRGERGV